MTKAVHALRTGGIVLHPTGSLYGLAADAHNPDAIRKLKALKKLDEDARPFVVIISAQWVEKLVALDQMEPENRVQARSLVARHWPGGVTLIVPASNAAPELACANTDKGPTLAIRADDHPAAVALCAEFGGPLVSTSANLHGTPSPLELTDVPPELRKETTLLDIGPKPIGTASTLVDFTVSPPVILREGRIPPKDLW